MLARTARHAAEALGLLDEVAETDLAACRHAVAYSSQALSISALLALSMARQRNLLRYWLRRQGFLAPAAAQLEEVLAQVQTAPRSQRAVCAGQALRSGAIATCWWPCRRSMHPIRLWM